MKCPTCRVLVCRRQHDGLGPKRPQPSRLRARFIDGQWSYAQTLGADDVAVHGIARILHRHALDTEGAKRACQQREAVREASTDDDVLGTGYDASDPAEVGGKGGAQLRTAPRVAVVEDLIWLAVEYGPFRPQPLGSRKRRSKVQPAGPKIDPDPLWTRRLSGGFRNSGAVVSHDRPGPRPSVEIPLGHELGVRLDHGSPRDVEILGERAARGQHGSGWQSAVMNGVSERPLESRPPAPWRVHIDIEVEIRRTGPGTCHQIGSY